MSGNPQERNAGQKRRTEKKIDKGKCRPRNTDPGEPKWDVNFMQQYTDQLLNHPVLLPAYKLAPVLSHYKLLQEKARARQAISDALGVNVSHHAFLTKYRQMLNNALLKAKRASRGLPLTMNAVLECAPSCIRKLETYYNFLPDMFNKYQENMSKKNRQPDFLRTLVTKMSIARHCGMSEQDATTCVAKVLGQSFQIIYSVWTKQCTVSLEKLRHLQCAGDAIAATPRQARLSAVDWIAVDVVLLYHPDQRLLSEESLRDFSQRSTLTTLFSIVQFFSLDTRDGCRRLWKKALENYHARGLSSSLVVLQRRWYELVAESRARLAAALRDPELQLPPLLKTIATRCRHLMTSPQPSWAELVKNGNIYYQTPDEHFKLEQKILEGKLPISTVDTVCDAQQNDDLILIEKEVETIELDSDEERLAGSSDNLLGPSVEIQGTPKPNQSNSKTPSIRSSMSDDEPLSALKLRYDTSDQNDRNDDTSDQNDRNDDTSDQNDRNDDFSSDEDDHLQIDENHDLEASTNTVTEVTVTNTTSGDDNLHIDENHDSEASTNTVTKVTVTDNTTNEVIASNSQSKVDSLSLFNQLNPTECETEVMFSDDDESQTDINFYEDNFDFFADTKTKKTVGNDLTESNKNFNAVTGTDAKVSNIEGLKEGKIGESIENNESQIGNVINSEKGDGSYKSNNTTAKNNTLEGITDTEKSKDYANTSELPKKGKPHSRNLKKVKEKKERERLMALGASGSSHENATPNESPNAKEDVKNNRITEIEDEEGDSNSKTYAIERDGEPPRKRIKPHSRNMKKAKELRRQRELLKLNENEQSTSLSQEICMDVDVKVFNDTQVDENMIGNDENSVKLCQNDDKGEKSDEMVEDDVKSDNDTKVSSDFEDYDVGKLLLKAVVPLKRIDDNNTWRKHAVNNTIDLIEAPNIANLGGRVVKRRYRRKTSNPDFDIRLKGLSEEFIELNKDLLKLCVPASVMVERITDQQYRAILLLRDLRSSRRTKVSLPSIDEVRRVNRTLLTAQVAPLSLTHTQSDPDPGEISDAASTSSNIPDNTLTQADYDSLLRRLCRVRTYSDKRKCHVTTYRNKPNSGGTLHCCLARRHIAINTARRRLAARAGKQTPPIMNVHGWSHEKECKCCCVAALREMPDDRTLNDSIKQLQRTLKELKRFTHNENPNETAASQAPQEENPGTSENKNKSRTTSEKPDNLEKDKSKSKSKKGKEKSKNVNTGKKRKDEDESYVNEYLEWQRQRTLHAKYFILKPNTGKKSKTSDEKQNKNDDLTKNDQLATNVGVPQNDSQIQNDQLTVNLDIPQSYDQIQNDRITINLDIPESFGQIQNDQLTINLDIPQNEHNYNDQLAEDITVDLTQTDNYDTHFLDNMTPIQINLDASDSEMNSELNADNELPNEDTLSVPLSNEETLLLQPEPENTNKSETETPKPKLKLVPTSRLQSDTQFSFNSLIENSSPATAGLQARMGFVASENTENTTVKNEENEFIADENPIIEESMPILHYIVPSVITEPNNQQNLFSEGHCQSNILSLEHNHLNVLPSAQIQMNVLPVPQNNQNVVTAAQFQLNVIPTTQNDPNVPPAVQYQLNVLPTAQNQPNVLSAEQNQRNVLPTAQNQPNMPHTSQNQLNVLPAAQNQPNVLSAAQNQTNVLPAGQNQPDVLPAPQNQSRRKQFLLRVVPQADETHNQSNELSTAQNQSPTKQYRLRVVHQEDVPQNLRNVLPIVQNEQNILPTAQNTSATKQFRLGVVTKAGNETCAKEKLNLLAEGQNQSDVPTPAPFETVHKLVPVPNYMLPSITLGGRKQTFKIKTSEPQPSVPLTVQNPAGTFQTNEKIFHILPSGETKVLYKVPAPQNVVSAVPPTQNVQPNINPSGETKVLYKVPPPQNVLPTVTLQPSVQPNLNPSGENLVLYKVPPPQNVLPSVTLQPTAQTNIISLNGGEIHLVPAKLQPGQQVSMITPEGLVVPQLVSSVGENSTQATLVPRSGQDTQMSASPIVENTDKETETMATVNLIKDVINKQIKSELEKSPMEQKEEKANMPLHISILAKTYSLKPDEDPIELFTDPSLPDKVELNQIIAEKESEMPINEETAKKAKVPKVLKKRKRLTKKKLEKDKLKGLKNDTDFRPSESLMSQLIIADTTDEFHKVFVSQPNESKKVLAKCCVIKYKKDPDVDPSNRVTKTTIKFSGNILDVDNDGQAPILERTVDDETYEEHLDSDDEVSNTEEEVPNTEEEVPNTEEDAIEISDESNDGGNETSEVQAIDSDTTKNCMPIISGVTSLCETEVDKNKKHLPISSNIESITQNKRTVNGNQTEFDNSTQVEIENDIFVSEYNITSNDDQNESNSVENNVMAMPNITDISSGVTDVPSTSTIDPTNAGKFANVMQMIQKINKISDKLQNVCQSANSEVFEPVISNIESLATENNLELATPLNNEPANTVVANSMPFKVTSQGPTPIMLLEYDPSDLQPAPNQNVLSNEPPIRASDYIKGMDPTTIQILCVDRSLPILRVLDSFLVITSRRLISDDPTFWTMAPEFGSRQLIFSDKSSQTQDGGRKATSKKSNAEGRGIPMPATIQSDGGEVLSAPEELCVNDKTFRKLTDVPLVYAEVWTVISSIDVVRSLARSKAPLSLYCQRIGRMIPLEHTNAVDAVGLTTNKAKDALKALVALLNGEQPPSISSEIIDLDSD